MQDPMRQQSIDPERDSAPCEVCGNVYRRPMVIQLAGRTHVFDSFECAIHLLAPKCTHCGCRILGHGEEDGDRCFCCKHCRDAMEEKPAARLVGLE